MYVGLDLGTSALKAVIVDDDQRIKARATAPLQISRPAPGWAEQDPADWIAALDQVMGDLARQIAMDDVQAIGLAGQMHGAVFLDGADAPLCPCILWNDTRAGVQAAQLDADPQFRAITGNIIFPGFTAPKLLWLAQHNPALRACVARVLLPKDYLRLWLTGDAISDMSDASGTGWLNVAARDWSDDLLAATGLTRASMPALAEGSQIAGRLRPAIARRWGLRPGVPLAGGGGDNAASAIGAGVVTEGDGFLSLGTSGVLFAPTRQFRPQPAQAVHSFCHALPDMWHQMGVTLACTDALNWFAGTLGRTAEQITTGLGPLQAPARPLFLPYLGGERTPHNDVAVRAAFLHLDHGTDSAAMVRCVLEGLSYALADGHRALTGAGTSIDRLVALGGGAASRYWLQVIATVLETPIDLPGDSDVGGALGAARLGMMAATGAGVAQVATRPAIARTIEPDSALQAQFAQGYALYRETYAIYRQLP